MRRMLAAVWVASAVAVVCPPATALDGEYQAVVTRIAVKLTQRLSSRDARVGESFAFDTASSVAVDGYFLAAGTHGRGVVIAVRQARGAQPGSLELAAQSIDLPRDGTLAVGLESGQLVPKTSVRGAANSGDLVFDRGTPFIVVTPPPRSASDATAG